MKKYFHLISILTITLLLTSCGKDEDPQANCSNQGTFTFNLNGNPWEATSFNNTLLVALDQSINVTARRCDIRAIDEDGLSLIHI